MKIAIYWLKGESLVCVQNQKVGGNYAVFPSNDLIVFYFSSSPGNKRVVILFK